LGNEKIATAVVRTTHGVRGFLKVKVFSDDVENFLSQKVLYLRDEREKEIELEVEQSTVSGDNVLVKFKGIDTPEQGKRLNGHHIWIFRKDASELEEDEYYLADLIGCAVYADSELHGEVVSVVEGAQAELLEVRRGDSGKLVYLPFLEVYIQSVDIEAKRIDLRNSWIIA
jgi:16S rRNA processing protein RimM